MPAEVEEIYEVITRVVCKECGITFTRSIDRASAQQAADMHNGLFNHRAPALTQVEGETNG